VDDRPAALSRHLAGELLEGPRSVAAQLVGRIVDRDAKPVIPPRVDYALTPLGREAAEQVSALSQWVQVRVGDVLAAREAYDGSREP
jgi:hypothetical protein